MVIWLRCLNVGLQAMMRKVLPHRGHNVRQFRERHVAGSIAAARDRQSAHADDAIARA